jgi:hypothetical protein
MEKVTAPVDRFRIEKTTVEPRATLDPLDTVIRALVMTTVRLRVVAGAVVSARPQATGITPAATDTPARKARAFIQMSRRPREMRIFIPFTFQ